MILKEGKPVFLSVVIPAYNEEVRISKTLEGISDYLQKKEYTYEIIVVDDGSLDSTVDLVGGISRNNGNIRVLRNGVNRGKGYSVKRGVLASSGEYVLFSDADLPIPIEEVEKLFDWLRSGYEIAIGSKRLKEFKSFKREAADRIFPKQLVEGFCFDVELLYLAKRWGIPVKEVPVRWTDRDAKTTVKIIPDSLQMVLDLFKIRINYWKGKYE